MGCRKRGEAVPAPARPYRLLVLVRVDLGWVRTLPSSKLFVASITQTWAPGGGGQRGEDDDGLSQSVVPRRCMVIRSRSKIRSGKSKVTSPPPRRGKAQSLVRETWFVFARNTRGSRPHVSRRGDVAPINPLIPRVRASSTPRCDGWEERERRGWDRERRGNRRS